ncbi:hypothetical protein L1887_32158 [Cichorium endivia]|nr:hypothetical protein L1887_32158 [Cichorium endivia]
MTTSSKSATGSAADEPSVTIASCNYLAPSDPSSFKEHLQQLYTIYGVPLPAAADDIPLKMSCVKGYSPQSDPIFSVVRRLPQAFLNLDDLSIIFITKHLTTSSSI